MIENVVRFPCPPAEEPDDSRTPQPGLEELQASVRKLVSLSGSDERVYRLRNFRSERYRLVDDLLVVIEEKDGQFVSSSLDTDQFGHGFSQEDAIQNLCEVIEEYYEVLQEDEGRLSPALESHLRYLRSILEAQK